VRTAIYRAFSPDGSLLYVGIAKNWGARWAQHAQCSPFFGGVARLDVRYMPTREEALVAEAEAIRNERPIWNVKHAEGPERRFCLLQSSRPGLVGAIVPAECLATAEGRAR
jgi:excinuclease UvrABC nuclease subunit